MPFYPSSLVNYIEIEYKDILNKVCLEVWTGSKTNDHVIKKSVAKYDFKIWQYLL